MNITIETSLNVKSNLFILKNGEIPAYDEEFLNIIREPDAIKKIRGIAPWHNYTALQKEIERTSASCAYSLPGDFSWGTIYENNIEKVICKCIKINCEDFKICRPDFNPEELNVLKENKEKNIYHKDPLIELIEEKKYNDIETVTEIETVENYETDYTEIDNIDEQILPESDFIAPAIPVPPVNIPAESTFAAFKPVKQEYLIRMAPDKRAIVNAGPGTGKTWTLIEKLIYMTEQVNVDPQNILVLCYSRAAVDVIQFRLKKSYENWNQIEVRSFDSFCTFMIAWVQENKPTLLPRGYVLEANDYDSRIMTAESILRKENILNNEYNHIIIDEVQDLVGCRADFVLQLLNVLPKNCGFSILGDTCQALYDWLANTDRTITTSDIFYRKLFNGFPDAEKLSFTENFRQREEPELANLTIPYREAILNNSSTDKLLDIHTKIMNRIKPTETTKKSHHELLSEINNIKKRGGSLGILTRTNACAFMISTWLDTEHIPHILQKSSDYLFLNKWIADIFISYNNDEITEDIFRNKYLEKNPDADADMIKEYWNALTEKTKGNGRYYFVKNILKSLNTSKNYFLLAGKTITTGITVSTIHKAKGREFDHVLLVDERDNEFFKNEKDEFLNHKVRYVALTRPKKTLNRHVIECQYIYVDRNDNRRCSKRNFLKWLTHIEIGCNGDIDTNSFTESELLQEYISDKMKPMDRLFLKKIDGTLSDYSIRLEENNSIQIGKTSKNLSHGITRAQRRMWTDNWYNYSINNELESYPVQFDDIYVEDIITCISRQNTNIPPHIKSFDGVSIWYGYTVHGFAHYDHNRH